MMISYQELVRTFLSIVKLLFNIMEIRMQTITNG
ncbi:hypothetical protein LR67_27710 [Escherichia coli]|nr:hypothetical protein LR66_28010 [Escherichia coli]KJD70383.1 hypothetical protein LR67_27710 [Escherichia coli]